MKKARLIHLLFLKKAKPFTGEFTPGELPAAEYT